MAVNRKRSRESQRTYSSNNIQNKKKKVTNNGLISGSFDFRSERCETVS
jgi:hypothetical protein